MTSCFPSDSPGSTLWRRRRAKCWWRKRDAVILFLAFAGSLFKFCIWNHTFTLIFCQFWFWLFEDWKSNYSEYQDPFTTGCGAVRFCTDMHGAQKESYWLWLPDCSGIIYRCKRFICAVKYYIHMIEFVDIHGCQMSSDFLIFWHLLYHFCSLIFIVLSV